MPSTLNPAASLVQPPAAPPAPPDKMQRNEELLNRIIAQQSTARVEQSLPVLDDLGIMDGALGQRAARRAPPRRAVTWVNEIRWVRTYMS